MIDGLAYRIAKSIKRANPEETSSIAVMQYALIIYINTAFILIESLLIGFISGKFMQTLICLLSINTLRYFSGGTHAKTMLQCNIVSVAIFTIIPYVPLYHSWLTPTSTIVSLILTLLFAPNIDSETEIPKEKRPKLKWVSIFIISCNFFANSWLLGLSFLVQSFTIIPIRGGFRNEVVGR